MGLDAVELVMTVEETFDITIPDADGEKILTMGHLYHYVLWKLQGEGQETEHCLTAATFYRLRRGLMRSFRVPRRAVRPDSSMESLIPARNRKSEWKRLGESLGWELPGLVRPGWVAEAYMGLLTGWLGIVLFVWARLADFAIGAIFPMGVGFLLGAGFLGAMLVELTKPFAVRIDPSSVRDIVPRILRTNLGRISGDDSRGWNHRDVWDVLVAMVADRTGTAAEQITESTSFVNDLGMD